MRWSMLWLLAGCHPWDLPDQGYFYLDGVLWDADAAVATADGLYVPLPNSGGLVLVKSDGSYAPVEVGDGRVRSLQVSPDGSRAMVTVDRFRCDTDDTDVEVVDDCPAQDLKVSSELAVVADGVVSSTIEVAPQYNALTWSSDGRVAIAYIDPALPVVQRGVVNLTSALVLQLDSATASTVSIGFDINRVLFTPANDKAVVLAQNNVSVVDLTGDVARKEVSFDLVLDNDLVVVPVGVDLTPDGQYALISAQGRDDLYVLDLVQHSVNIVTLAAPPSAMTVDTTSDRTLLVSGGANRAEILDHEYFDVVEVPLDEAMTNIIPGEGSAVLWREGAQDIYRIDLVTGGVVEYRMQEPVYDLQVSPSATVGVAFTQGNRMELLDLASDRGRSVPYALETMGVGAAFSRSDAGEHVLVLQEGVDYLYDLDLLTGSAAEVALSASPLGIGVLPDGVFYVTLNQAMGRVAFLDPTTGVVTEADGFGRIGLFDETSLVGEE
jgi:hypothetical protein